jgi:hypothetical protein
VVAETSEARVARTAIFRLLRRMGVPLGSW